MSATRIAWGLMLGLLISFGTSPALAVDSDGDGVDDLLDVCPNTPPGIVVDPEGRPYGDLDLDCDVDIDDFILFQSNFTGPIGEPEICDDGIDNDLDSLIDCEDPDCDGQTCGVNGLICIEETCQCPGDTEICDDGVDNDCDGMTDCADLADCPQDTACGPFGYACDPNAICSCTPPWADCDGNYANGCETDLDTDPDHCGACWDACDIPNATSQCVGGECQMVACHTGWCDDDGLIGNGCEKQLDLDLPCSSSIYIGSVAGDDSSNWISHNHVGEQWFYVLAREDDTSPFSPEDLGVTVYLMPAGGTDYDLYVYCSGCVALAGSSTNGGSTPEMVIVGWEDSLFEDDDREIYIKVDYVHANTCAEYTLQVEPNTPGPDNCAGP